MPVITWVRTGTDNQKFKLEKVAMPVEIATESSSSSEVVPESSSSGTTAIGSRDIRTNRANMLPLQQKNGYRDLKGRRFDKQIPYRVMF